MKQQNTQDENEKEYSSLNSILAIKQIRVKIKNLEDGKVNVISYLGKNTRAEEDIEDFKRCSHLEVIWVKEKKISFYDNLLRKEKAKLKYYKKKWHNAIMDFKIDNKGLKKELWYKQKKIEIYIKHIQDKQKEDLRK